MGLKFLEPDRGIAYIQESLTPAERSGEPDHAFYRKGRRPAVIVIDMQRAYTSPEPKPWVREVSPGVQEITDTVVAHVG